MYGSIAKPAEGNGQDTGVHPREGFSLERLQNGKQQASMRMGTSAKSSWTPHPPPTQEPREALPGLLQLENLPESQVLHTSTEVETKCSTVTMRIRRKAVL